MLFAILCTGPSMSQDVANSVRNLSVVAVNGAYELAPWADALVANDTRWWFVNQEAKQFAGRKFSANNVGDVERVPNIPGLIGSGVCSGVIALEVAKMMGAKQIVLLGADMRGTHYFGDYPSTLSKTTEARRGQHAIQFKRWRNANPDLPVFNCTPGSALTCFPMARLEDLC